MGWGDEEKKPADLLSSPREFFSEAVTEALQEVKVDTYPLVSAYIAELLEHYIVTENLFDDEDGSGRKRQKTLAELFLRAANSEPRRRFEMLKRLGDTSLYITGFFGESLQRKIVDLDYYVDMGCTAYDSLAGSVSEDTFSKVFREMSIKFVKFVDVLSYISEKAIPSSELNMLHQYDKYVKTGSEFARDRLIESGILAVPVQTANGKKQ